MRRTTVAITHQQRMDQAILRRRCNRLRWLLIMLLRCDRLRRLLIMLLWCNRLCRLLIMLLWCNRLCRLLIMLLWCNRLWRLLIMLLRCNWLRRLLIMLLRRNGFLVLRRGLRHYARRKQRLMRPLIHQRFHWRKFKVIEGEWIRSGRLFTGITLLLRRSKLAGQFRFCG